MYFVARQFSAGTARLLGPLGKIEYTTSIPKVEMDGFLTKIVCAIWEDSGDQRCPKLLSPQLLNLVALAEVSRVLDSAVVGHNNRV
jgi:hypothetical protein